MGIFDLWQRRIASFRTLIIESPYGRNDPKTIVVVVVILAIGIAPVAEGTAVAFHGAEADPGAAANEPVGADFFDR